MKTYWNIIKKELIRLIAITGFSYIAGLLYDLIVIYYIIGGLQDISIIPMGCILSMIVGTSYWIIGNTVSLKTRFTLAVSMSITRKNYIRQEIIGTILGTLILCAMFFFLFWMETEILEQELLFDTVCRNLFSGLPADLFYLAVIICFVTGIRLLFGFLILRFYQYVFWGIWAVCIICPALAARIERSRFGKTLIANFQILNAQYHGYFLPFVMLITGILVSCIGIFLLKRQEIRNV